MLNDFQLTQNLTLNNSNSWELSVLNDKGNCETIIYLKHHLIKNNQILAIEKLIPKKLYSLSILLENELPTSQQYFSNIFSNSQVKWKQFYPLPCTVPIDTNLRMFQYKLWNTILHLKEKFFIFN